MTGGVSGQDANPSRVTLLNTVQKYNFKHYLSLLACSYSHVRVPHSPVFLCSFFTCGSVTNPTHQKLTSRRLAIHNQHDICTQVCIFMTIFPGFYRLENVEHVLLVSVNDLCKYHITFSLFRRRLHWIERITAGSLIASDNLTSRALNLPRASPYTTLYLPACLQFTVRAGLCRKWSASHPGCPWLIYNQ